MTIKGTFALILSDCRRLLSYTDKKRLSPLVLLSLLVRPEINSIAIYRISHYCHTHRFYRLARMLFQFNMVVNGVELYPNSVIGPGCLLVHPVGASVFGRLGKEATLFSHVIIGSDQFNCPIDEAPQIGDHVVISSMASVLGAITIGNDVTIAPCSLIEHSIPESLCLVSRMPNCEYIVKRYSHETVRSMEERKLRKGK